MVQRNVRSLHVVQIGTDDSVFRKGAPSDTLLRQIQYGEELARQRPGSRLSVLMATDNPTAQRIDHGHVVFIPIRGERFMRRWPALISALIALQRERPIDVLTTQGVMEDAWIVLAFGKLAGVPVVGQLHFDIFSAAAQRDVLGTGIVGHIRYTLCRRLFPRYAAVRVVAQGIQRYILTKRLHTRVAVIPVPVTMPATNETIIPQPTGRRILFVGRLVPEKNLSDWLQVAARVIAQDATVEWMIVGDGPLRASLEQQAHTLGIAQHGQFLGAVAYDDLTTIYRSASVFLLTSDYEGFGRVLVEAYLQQLPVVSSSVTGPVDIIDHGVTGFLCTPGDIEDMAAKVLHLLHNEPVRQQMGLAGYHLVRERFAPQRLTREWIELLVSVASDNEYVTLPPRRATWKRWWRLSDTRYTLLRALEYESLTGLVVRGRTLDIGGGAHISYRRLLHVEGTIESVNIDPRIHPTMVADLNTSLPITNAQYDTIISLNTLEHIAHDTNALQEVFRVLKPGGAFHLVVPFLYRVHGSPFDYHRHTAQWWYEFLVSLDVDPTSLTIEPLVWSPRTSALALTNFHLLPGLQAPLKRISMLPTVLFHKLYGLVFAGDNERMPRNQRSRIYAEYALGYYVSGRR